MQHNRYPDKKIQGYADLPMYDFPHIQEATDAWWSALARKLEKEGFENIPDHIARDDRFEANWTNAHLVMSQTCGYPFMFQLGHDVQLLGTPVYDADGCEGPYYSSVIVVRKDIKVAEFSDMEGLTLAISSKNSHSGMNIIRYLTATSNHKPPFWGKKIISGGHEKSLQLIADKKADVASIDAVTFALLRDENPELSNDIQVYGGTPKAPGLPYITSNTYSSREIKLMQKAILKVFEDNALAGIRKQLRLKGFVPMQRSDYQTIVDMETFALEKGFSDFI